MKDDVEAVIERAGQAGVGVMLAINARLSEYDEVLEIANKWDHIYGTVGSHPHEAENEPNVTVDKLIELAAPKKIIAIGETGLDYFYEHSPREMQKQNFIAHIEASRALQIPLIVHARDADDDVAEIMSSEMKKGEYPAVIHCFTASQKFLEQSLDIGCMISISGIVTFNSAKDLQASVKTIPLERMLVETDAPYLAPVPMRGKPNEPAFVKHTIDFLSTLLDVPVDEFIKITTDNFFNHFTQASRPQISKSEI